MMTIEEEIEMVVTFLSHPAGFNIDFAGLLSLRPTDECSPPETWEVEWDQELDGYIVTTFRNFETLQDAARFYVEKRHQLCYGLDFDVILASEIDD